jgi:hypothetical protein
VRDAAHDVQVFAGQHFDALMAELDDRAQASAEAVDDALGAVADAYRQREMRANHVHRLVAVVAGRSRPDAVPPSRVERIANACHAVIDAGGETVPRLRRDPRQPTTGAVAEVSA